MKIVETKIKRVELENIKHVKQMTAFWDGNSGHITGQNGEGKSTFITFFWDYLQKKYPAQIVTRGETDGVAVMEMTDGGVFRLEANTKGKEKLTYVDRENKLYKGHSEMREIIEAYFPHNFDLNLFLHTSQPRTRLDMISKLLNVDLTDVNARRSVAFDNRKNQKRELKSLEGALPKRVPSFNSEINIDTYTAIEREKVALFSNKLTSQKQELENERTRLNNLYSKNVKENSIHSTEHETAYQLELTNWNTENDAARKLVESGNKILRDGWKVENEKHIQQIQQANRDNTIISKKLENARVLNNDIINLTMDTWFSSFIDWDGIDTRINAMSQPMPEKPLTNLTEPTPNTFTPTKRPEKTAINLPDPKPSGETLIPIQESIVNIERKIAEYNNKIAEKEKELINVRAEKMTYDNEIKRYRKQVESVDAQKEVVQNCENEHGAIIKEIEEIVKAADLPSRFQISFEGKKADILFQTEEGGGFFPITQETLASSAIYIAGFELVIYRIGKLAATHLDVSFLDWRNIDKIRAKAEQMGIQLFTESPSKDRNQKDELHVEIYNA